MALVYLTIYNILPTATNNSRLIFIVIFVGVSLILSIVIYIIAARFRRSTCRIIKCANKSNTAPLILI